MWAEKTSRDMVEEGMNPERIVHGQEFVDHYSKVQIAEFRDQSITVFIRQDPTSDYFLRVPDGNIYINISFFHQVDKASHIYIDYIVRSIIKYHKKVNVVIHWASVDLYLKNTFSSEQAIRTHHHLALFNYFCRKSGLGNVVGVSDFQPVVLGSDPKFFARPGNVELRAIRTILRYPLEVDAICTEIIANWDREEFMYKSNTSSDEAVADHGHAIRQLITNAGLYGSTKENLIASIQSWTNRYISGLFGSQELYMRWDYAVHSHVARIAAFEAGLTFQGGGRAIFGSIDEFYSQIAGKKILIISPFASACEQVVKTGRIKSIWKKRVVPDFSLVGLSAYITTYPNRPHDSWHETFEVICDGIDKIMKEEEIDLVLGSCGCYGIPLLDFCFKKYGISSVYYGNFIHLFFGIKLNDFSNHFDDANLDHWINPFEEMVAVPTNFARIDAGRYVVSQ